MTAILLTGRTGQTGWELQRALAPLGQVIATGRGELDLADPDSIRAALRQAKPAIIVNAGGFTAVDEVEQQPELAMRVNGVAPGVLAEEAKRLGALLVHYSTAHVFDGVGTRPYAEDDAPNPVNVYGKSKLAGERAITATGCDHLVLRTSWIYSFRGTNFLTAILALAREKAELPVVDDQIGSPTWARALAEATAEILKNRARTSRGIYHLSAGGQVSRCGFARRIIENARALAAGKGAWPRVRPIKSAEYPLPAQRPPNSVLATARIRREFGISLPSWEDQLLACQKAQTGV